MMADKTLTPEPVPTQTVCSVCGLDWLRHLDETTTEHPDVAVCIKLLKAELAKRPWQHAFQQASSFRSPTYG